MRPEGEGSALCRWGGRGQAPHCRLGGVFAEATMLWKEEAKHPREQDRDLVGVLAER